MFRVIIADDEVSVIHSLLESVRWEELDMEVAGTASEGYEALKLAQEKQADIAILDIRMPGINGLELCERLRKENEQIQLIIISGYAEFAYAEKAIQYGVIGYCLKPLEYTQITRTLRKAAQNLKTARHMAVKEDLIDILERKDEREIRESLRSMGVSAEGCYAAVSTGEKPVEELDGFGLSIRLGRGQWGYILESDRVGARRASLAGKGGWQGIGYIPRPVKAACLYDALEECIARAYQYFVDENNRICTGTDESRANGWLDEMGNEVRNGRWDRVAALLEEIERKGMGDFTVRSSLRLCNLIYSTPVFRNAENDLYIYSIEQLVTEFGTLRSMLRLLRSPFEGTQADYGEDSFTNSAFMKLLRYVNENYRGNISLAGTAQDLYMNPNYVSQLFKKEAGVTFVQYITQKRVEDAKELLVSTRKPLMDIAIEVGFNDYFYFIKTFKKITGLAPGQYRNQN